MEQPKIEKVIYWNLGIYFGYMLFSKLCMSQANAAHGNDAYYFLFFAIGFPICCPLLFSFKEKWKIIMNIQDSKLILTSNSF